MTQVVEEVKEEEVIEEETEEDVEVEEEVEEEVKEVPLPNFIEMFNITLEDGEYDPELLNLRRKHPALGKKIANLHRRALMVEESVNFMKDLLSPYLNEQYKKKVSEQIDHEWDDILRSL